MMRRFPAGQILSTPGALEAMDANGQSLARFLERHLRGDWGEALCPEDCQANEDALLNSGRLLSAYYLRNGQKLWMITEWDRSATTALLPSEY